MSLGKESPYIFSRAITSNEPWNTETNKVDRNAPIPNKHVFRKRSARWRWLTEQKKAKIPSKFAKRAAWYNEFGCKDPQFSVILIKFERRLEAPLIKKRHYPSHLHFDWNGKIRTITKHWKQCDFILLYCSVADWILLFFASNGFQAADFTFVMVLLVEIYPVLWHLVDCLCPSSSFQDWICIQELSVYFFM